MWLGRLARATGYEAQRSQRDKDRKEEKDSYRRGAENAEARSPKSAPPRSLRLCGSTGLIANLNSELVFFAILVSLRSLRIRQRARARRPSHDFIAATPGSARVATSSTRRCVAATRATGRGDSRPRRSAPSGR